MEASSLLLSLKNLGLKNTVIRRNLLNFFHNSSNPVSASDILTSIKANKTTIYRELGLLLSKNFIIEVHLGDGLKRYELAQKNHHHHLICIRCKSVTDFDLQDDFTREEALITSQQKFIVLRHSLEFFGICHQCN